MTWSDWKSLHESENGQILFMKQSQAQQILNMKDANVHPTFTASELMLNIDYFLFRQGSRTSEGSRLAYFSNNYRMYMP